MFKFETSGNIEENYKLLAKAVQSHLADEPDLIANLANIASFIYNALPDLNWAGFYLLQNDTLVLGPFMGKPACTRIPLGRGVCGRAAAENLTTVVADVHAFDDHIACDSDTNSEIVIPLVKDGEVFGVLDVDSPIYNRFGSVDTLWLTKIAGSINDFLNRK